jgi:hypothetical protein
LHVLDIVDAAAQAGVEGASIREGPRHVPVDSDVNRVPLADIRVGHRRSPAPVAATPFRAPLDPSERGSFSHSNGENTIAGEFCEITGGKGRFADGETAVVGSNAASG